MIAEKLWRRCYLPDGWFAALGHYNVAISSFLFSYCVIVSDPTAIHARSAPCSNDIVDDERERRGRR
jgi:hypothetical protein